MIAKCGKQVRQSANYALKETNQYFVSTYKKEISKNFGDLFFILLISL